MTNKNPKSIHPKPIGFGVNKAKIHVYIENIPPLPEYKELSSINPLQIGDINRIGQLTGNHWRKIFNVFAKVLFEYHPQNFTSWQSLRDEYLLQSHSNECLVFSPTYLSEIKRTKRNSCDEKEEVKVISIIMGKTYAKKLGVAESSYWLSESFAVNKYKNLIICPYFDYRQLSNVKITQLVQLIKQLEAKVNNF
jgi:hypothetical protein